MAALKPLARKSAKVLPVHVETPCGIIDSPRELPFRETPCPIMAEETPCPIMAEQGQESIGGSHATAAASHTPGSTARPTSIILGEDGTFHPSNPEEFGNTRRTSLEFMNTGTKMMRRTATVRGRVFMKMSEPDDADAIAAEFNQPGGLVWKRWFWCVHCTTRLRERAPARSVPWPGQRPRIHSRLPSLGRLLPRPTALLCPVLTAVCARTCHLGPAW